MATTLKHAEFSEAKKAMLNYKKFNKWMKKAVIEAGAWFLAFITFFTLMEVVLWIAAMFSF